MHAAARAAVAERLARFDSSTRAIVTRGALLGYRLDPGELAACSGTTPDRVLAALLRACRTGLIVAEGRGPARFRFRHALTRAAVRDSLEPSERRRLHASIAAGLEALGDPDARAEQLAYHWLGAGADAKAARYCGIAAERARRLGADEDARRYAALAHRMPVDSSR